MSFEMGYLADVKGDMARLGYLKILTSTVSQSKTIMPENLADSLNKACTVDANPRWEAEMIEQEKNGLSKTGMIPKGTAKSYVDFAKILGLYNFDRWALEESGIILDQILDKNDKKELDDLVTNPLVLKDFEKIFFWNMFIAKDGQIIIPLMKYIAQKETATRKEMMNALMEEDWGYRIFLTNAISDPNTGWDDRNKFQARLPGAENYREQRIQAEEGKTWNTTEQYALYRHFADPRIQWLVDLGFLQKKSTSSYEGTSITKSIIRVIEELETHVADGEPYELITKLSEIFCPNLQPLPEEELNKKIVGVYEIFHNLGSIIVKKNILCDIVFFTCIKQGKYISRQKIMDQIENMLNQFPTCVSTNVDTHGKPVFIHIKVPEIKKLL